MKYFGLDTKVRVWTDSSAAMGISSRSGLGKLRHLETHTLWVQGKVKEKAFELRKVRGEVNPADLFTKHLASKDRVHNLTELFSCSFRDGRSEAAPMLRKKDDADKDGFGDLGNDGDLDCDLFDAEFEDAKLHDVDTLPHSYSTDDINHLLPIIYAADAEYDLLDWDPDMIYYGQDSGDTSTTSATASTPTTPTTCTAPATSAGASVGELRARAPASALAPAPVPGAGAAVGEDREPRDVRHAAGAWRIATSVARRVGELRTAAPAARRVGESRDVQRTAAPAARRVGESHDDQAYLEARKRRAERDATAVAPRMGA